MFDSQYKTVISWFISEFPEYGLTISPTVSGVRILVKHELKAGIFASQKELLIGRDFLPTPDEENAAIRRAICSAVEEIRQNEISVSPTGQQTFFNLL